MAEITLPLLRTSERGQFKRCPQRWQWGTVEGWGPVGPPDVKLWFGTGWHALMDYWYCEGTKRGARPLKFWRDWIGQETVKIRVNLTGADEYKEEVYIEAGELGELMWGHYLDTYGKDEHMHFIQTEHKGSVIITRPGTNGKMVEYVFTYDGIYIDAATGKIWLIEHKTAKGISTAHLDLDDQGGSYWAVATVELRNAGLIKPSQSLAGIMYNFVRKSPPDDRPLNADGLATNKPTKDHYMAALDEAGVEYDPKLSAAKIQLLADEHNLVVLGEVSKNQPAKNLIRYPVFRTRAERNKQIRKIQDEFLVMEQFRAGNLPIIKNPTKDCKWDCSFYEACLLDERGGDYSEYMDAMMKQGDAYDVYRKSADAGMDQ